MGGRTAAEGLVSSYIHAGSRIGVLLEINCETDFVARNPEFKELVDNFAMQIAASPNVEYVSVDDADQEFLAKEREIEMGKEDLQGKPENIRAQIVEGRMAKLVKEKALLEQPYIIDTEKTVGEALKATVAKLGENMQVRRFVRFNLGEGIEKKTSYETSIIHFIKQLRTYPFIIVETNGMSTQIFGDYDNVMHAINTEMKNSFLTN